MNRAGVEEWIAAYERAWRTPGTDALARLFSPDATYSTSPYARPIEGLDAIAEMWEAGRRGPDERFTMAAAVVAGDGSTAVARIEVHYLDEGPRDEGPLDEGPREWRDLWVMQFDDQGLCRAFEEWPLPPGQDDGH